MMNDPLLPPPPPSAQKQPMTKRNSKKPATSAKILVTGLSATAVLGMASGYALAGKTSARANVNTTNTVDGITATGQPQIESSPLLPVDPPVAPNTVAPRTTNPPVVQIPVPQVTPATPGNSNNGWQQQQSSGSR